MEVTGIRGTFAVVNSPPAGTVVSRAGTKKGKTCRLSPKCG